MTEWQSMESVPEKRSLMFKSGHDDVNNFMGEYFCADEKLKNGMVLIRRYVVPEENKTVRIDYRQVNGWMEPPK